MPVAQRTRIESLDCIVVDGGPSPEIAVVICHGYGASYEDLAPLSGEWIGLLGEQASKFRFVFPDAPHSLAELGMPEARAWWPINMARLAAAIQASQFDELHDQEPPGIEAAREVLCQTIGRVKEDLGGDATPLVLGGFSQGAMLTMDVALRSSAETTPIVVSVLGHDRLSTSMGSRAYRDSTIRTYFSRMVQSIRSCRIPAPLRSAKC